MRYPISITGLAILAASAKAAAIPGQFDSPSTPNTSSKALASSVVAVELILPGPTKQFFNIPVPSPEQTAHNTSTPTGFSKRASKGHYCDDLAATCQPGLSCCGSWIMHCKDAPAHQWCLTKSDDETGDWVPKDKNGNFIENKKPEGKNTDEDGDGKEDEH